MRDSKKVPLTTAFTLALPHPRYQAHQPPPSVVIVKRCEETDALEGTWLAAMPETVESRLVGRDRPLSLSHWRSLEGSYRSSMRFMDAGFGRSKPCSYVGEWKLHPIRGHYHLIMLTAFKRYWLRYQTASVSNRFDSWYCWSLKSILAQTRNDATVSVSWKQGKYSPQAPVRDESVSIPLSVCFSSLFPFSPRLQSNFWSLDLTLRCARQLPAKLIDQLQTGGRMVVPVEEQVDHQVLMVVDKQEDGSLSVKKAMNVVFVPLTTLSSQLKTWRWHGKEVATNNDTGVCGFFRGWGPGLVWWVLSKN